MKKSALALCSLLVVCVLISPKIVGYKIASSLNEAVDAINETAEYRAEIVTIESGWFTTKANIQLAIDASVLADVVDVQKDANHQLQIAFDASHGPVQWAEKSGIGWALWSVDVTGDSLREFLDWQQGAALYHMDGSAGLLGTVNYSHVIPVLTAQSAIENTLINFSGHQGNYNGSERAYNSDGGSDIIITAPQGTISANFNASMLDVEPVPASLNNALEHALMTGKVLADKAAIESIMETVFEKQYENYKIPRQMTKEDIKARANTKMLFVLSMLNIYELIKATDTHYSAVVNIEDKQLTIHNKTISLPI